MSVAHVDPVEASLAARFATRYDELLAQPWVAPFYENSGFFNTGYRTDSDATQKQACQRLMSELAAWLPPAPSDLLDAGCGLGATTADLRRRFPAARIVGINISPGQIEQCRRMVADAEFSVMDAARIEFPDRSFDAVISVEAAFHFSTRERFFAESARVLRRGGRLVLSDILYRDVSVVGGWMVPSANRITALDSYREQLAAAGLDSIQVVDATQECWLGFCAGLRKWFRAQHAAGFADAQTAAGVDELSRRLEGCVAHYVLASATRESA